MGNFVSHLVTATRQSLAGGKPCR